LILYDTKAYCMRCNSQYHAFNISYENNAPREHAISLWADLIKCN
jgi:hypothetical protein